jgi:hypothetical protein
MLAIAVTPKSSITIANGLPNSTTATPSTKGQQRAISQNLPHRAFLTGSDHGVLQDQPQSRLLRNGVSGVKKRPVLEGFSPERPMTGGNQERLLPPAEEMEERVREGCRVGMAPRACGPLQRSAAAAGGLDSDVPGCFVRHARHFHSYSSISAAQSRQRRRWSFRTNTSAHPKGPRRPSRAPAVPRRRRTWPRHQPAPQNKPQ